MVEVNRADLVRVTGCRKRTNRHCDHAPELRHISESLNDGTEDDSGGRLRGEHAPREVFGTHADYFIGFLQRMDNLEFATYGLSTDLE